MVGTERFQPDSHGLFVVGDGGVVLALLQADGADVMITQGDFVMLGTEYLHSNSQGLFVVFEGLVVFAFSTVCRAEFSIREDFVLFGEGMGQRLFGVSDRLVVFLQSIENFAETLEEENMHGLVFLGAAVESTIDLGHLRLGSCVLSFLEEGIRLGGHLLDFLVGKLFDNYTRLGSLLALSFLLFVAFLFVGSFILTHTSCQQEGDAKGK